MGKGIQNTKVGEGKVARTVLKHDRNLTATTHSPCQGLLLSKVVYFWTTEPVPPKIGQEKEGKSKGFS